MRYIYDIIEDTYNYTNLFADDVKPLRPVKIVRYYKITYIG